MGLADRLMPPQAAEISSYSANQEITSICADFLVVRPVPRNASPKANSLRAGKRAGNFSILDLFDKDHFLKPAFFQARQTRSFRGSRAHKDMG
jgi:hypothetical protein